MTSTALAPDRASHGSLSMRKAGKAFLNLRSLGTDGSAIPFIGRKCFPSEATPRSTVSLTLADCQHYLRLFSLCPPHCWLWLGALCASLTTIRVGAAHLSASVWGSAFPPFAGMRH